MATSGLVARKVTTYGADLVCWRLNAATLAASGATELALIGFARRSIQQFEIREILYVGAEQQRFPRFDRKYSSRPQYNRTEKNLYNLSITTVHGLSCKANS
jgi:hypothetical protein